MSGIRTHDLTRITINLIHYTTRGYFRECMEYFLFYHQMIKIFCTKKQKKLVI